MRKLRGNSVAMIFQDALAALHPFYKIGGQLAEAYLVHHPSASKRDARRKAIEMLDRVGIPQPDRRVDDFPHQFSGGMRQRAMIAMGLINDPSLLIADEPTTALDVTVQAQILDLLQDLQREFNSAVIIITHDLGVIAEMADDVLVMYAGRCVEYGTTKEILTAPGDALHVGPALQHPRRHGAHRRPADPDPGQPAEPAAARRRAARSTRAACTRDKVPGDLCSHGAARAAAGELAGTAHLKRCHLADPDGDLPDRGAARDRPRPRRGDPMTQDPNARAEIEPTEVGANAAETGERELRRRAARGRRRPRLARDASRTSTSPALAEQGHVADRARPRRRAGARRSRTSRCTSR